MNVWPHKVDNLSFADIKMAINNNDWQRFRKSLKGLPTATKLDELDNYLTNNDNRLAKIRVDNYINALKRGGQLDLDLNIRK